MCLANFCFRPGAGIHGLLARNYAWRVVLRPHRWHSTVSIPPPPKLNVSVMTWKSWNPSQHRMPPNSRFAICVPSGPHGILSELLPSSKVVPGAGANDRQGSSAACQQSNTWAAASERIPAAHLVQSRPTGSGHKETLEKAESSGPSRPLALVRGGHTSRIDR